MVKKILAKLYIYFVLLLMYAPILVLIVFSFSSVTSIGDEAFYNCTKVKSIILPDSTLEIGSYAFEGCKSLKSLI